MGIWSRYTFSHLSCHPILMSPCFEPHVVSRFLASCVSVCSPLEVHSSCAIICPWSMLRFPLVLLYPSSYYGSSFLKRIRLARVASSILVGLVTTSAPSRLFSSVSRFVVTPLDHCLSGVMVPRCLQLKWTIIWTTIFIRQSNIWCIYPVSSVSQHGRMHAVEHLADS